MSDTCQTNGGGFKAGGSVESRYARLTTQVRQQERLATFPDGGFRYKPIPASDDSASLDGEGVRGTRTASSVIVAHGERTMDGLDDSLGGGYA